MDFRAFTSHHYHIIIQQQVIKELCFTEKKEKQPAE